MGSWRERNKELARGGQRRNSLCKSRMKPRRKQSRDTWVRKKFVVPLPILGIESRSSIAGTRPKRSVGPGCTFQHEGRAHHTRRLRTRANAATSLSNTLRERFTAGVMK